MHRAGTASWRIAVDNGKALNAACYVRDVGGLPLGDGQREPPRLMHLSVGASSPTAVEAAPAWSRWWTALTSDARADLQSVSAPGAEERDSSAALTLLLGRLQGEAAVWSNDLARRHPAPDLPPYAPAAHCLRRQQLHREVAEDVIRDYAVTPDRVTARVELIWSGEAWEHQPSAGVLFCSIATWADEGAYRVALSSTFERGLARRETG